MTQHHPRKQFVPVPVLTKTGTLPSPPSRGTLQGRKTAPGRKRPGRLRQLSEVTVRSSAGLEALMRSYGSQEEEEGNLLHVDSMEEYKHVALRDQVTDLIVIKIAIIYIILRSPPT